MAGQRLHGALNLSKLLKAAKAKNKAFFKTEKGDIMFWVDIWINDTPDQYGNDASVQLQTEKGSNEKIYFGNAKFQKHKEQQMQDDEIPDPENLPF